MEVEPDGQQASGVLDSTAATVTQCREQSLPISLLTKQGMPLAGQLVGQAPSHSSPLSTTPLPHFGLQSLSLVASAFSGQQASPDLGDVTGMCTHSALHCSALPRSVSVVQTS
jgi:hypothetical protein